jgi:hypothetical protein
LVAGGLVSAAAVHVKSRTMSAGILFARERRGAEEDICVPIRSLSGGIGRKFQPLRVSQFCGSRKHSLRVFALEAAPLARFRSAKLERLGQLRSLR